MSSDIKLFVTIAGKTAVEHYSSIAQVDDGI